MEELKKLKLFITGPIYISEKIKNASLLPEFGHRDSENSKRIAPIVENLKKIANIEGEFDVVIIPGSGSNAMEASIKSLVKDSDKVLNISVGAFGDLYHKITKQNGKNAKKLKFNAGESIDLEVLEKELAEFKPDVVTFTHNETSTGVMNDIAAVSNLIKNHNALVLVDGVSIFGGAPAKLKEADVDYYCFSTQKSIGADSGAGIAFIGRRAKEKIESVENRGYTTDLAEHLKCAAKSQILTTPNCSLINQLYVQLDFIVNEEGIENRFQRHKQMMDYTHEWIKTLPEGFILLPEKNTASPTLTAIKVPKKFTIDALKKVKAGMREQGYLMDPGYSKLNKQLEEDGQQLTMRVGHMGDITMEMLKEYLDLLKKELIKIGGY